MGWIWSGVGELSLEPLSFRICYVLACSSVLCALSVLDSRLGSLYPTSSFRYGVHSAKKLFTEAKHGRKSREQNICSLTLAGIIEHARCVAVLFLLLRLPNFTDFFSLSAHLPLSFPTSVRSGNPFPGWSPSKPSVRLQQRKP